MRLTHVLGDAKISRESDETVSFFLGNKKQGYASLSSGARSRYDGVFFEVDKEIYRVLADIRLDGKPTGFKNSFWSFQREYDQNTESFFMPNNLNSMVYELEKSDWVNITLDVRHTYDTSAHTDYEIIRKDQAIVVKCMRGGRDFFVCIKAESPEFEFIQRYVSDFCEADRKRNSPPFELEVYSLLRVKTNRLIFSFSTNLEEAVFEAENVSSHLKALKRNQENYVWGLVGKKNIRSDDVWLAYNCAVCSLDQLTTSERILAGFPWFFQPWTRDELISIKSVDSKLEKKILLKNLDFLLEDGRIPNIIPGSQIGSADAVGWLFKRISESIALFSSREKKQILDKLTESLNRISKNYITDFLVYNKPQETWMDSMYGDDGREGARIEIQAMFLQMYHLAYLLSKNENFILLEKLMHKRIRDVFWDGKILKDGARDPTIRPNVFLAAYIYPRLLTSQEWEICFKNILHKLWCCWGGLSSIDQDHPLFEPHSTGENPKSYHRGDSWFFLNNLAAKILYSVNKKEFEDYIISIFNASTHDILWGGALGSHSEISSAREQSAEGCRVQAWSCAMYIELVNQLYPG